MRPGSLRWKIAALIVLACGAVTAVVGVLVHDMFRERGMREGEGRAMREVTQTAEEYRTRRPPSGVTPWTDWIRHPTALPEPLRARLVRGEPVTWYDDTQPEQPWMWAGLLLDDGMVSVSQTEMASDLLRLRALDRAMVKAALTALAVAVPLSVLLAEPVNRRLRRVAVTARKIADGDLDARVGARRAGGDEIADISAAVDSMAASLQHRLLAEQRFTADVAHDLRTPLMGLGAAAALLDDGEAAGLVRDRVRVLRALVEDLLEISRLDAGAEVAERVRVPLADLAAQSAARSGVEARVRAFGDPVAETDPRRLDRILANLLVNAQRHGAAPVEVVVAAEEIAVRDHGPGYPAVLLADGPQRFRTGAEERGRGHGLGLTIALGQAAVIGAELTFANAPDGGAVARLRLPR
ncbi:HAMP domain-containing sensor histidine kinase [Nonomuraea longicatena]|uniref:histidine kinase n=1 Tax=Nonomuraea longicatena TaxID=83682 RepID=A0ABP4B6A7_9ACTN